MKHRPEFQTDPRDVADPKIYLVPERKSDDSTSPWLSLITKGRQQAPLFPPKVIPARQKGLKGRVITRKKSKLLSQLLCLVFLSDTNYQFLMRLLRVQKPELNSTFFKTN